MNRLVVISYLITRCSAVVSLQSSAHFKSSLLNAVFFMMPTLWQCLAFREILRTEWVSEFLILAVNTKSYIYFFYLGRVIWALRANKKYNRNRIIVCLISDLSALGIVFFLSLSLCVFLEILPDSFDYFYWNNRSQQI